MMGIMLIILVYIMPGIRTEAAEPVLSGKSFPMVRYTSLQLKLKNASGTVSWSSSNKGIACVSSTGRVTAVKAGTCKIYAKYKGKSYACSLKVLPLKLKETKVTVFKGRQWKLFLNTDKLKGVTWTSSNKAVATISSCGKIKAWNKGTCVMTAKYKGCALKCQVTVKQGTLAGLTSKYKVTSATKGRVLLAGSSILDWWTEAWDDFQPYKVMNTAIAGTRVPFWQQNYKRLITAYQPKAVVLYVGTNDIGNADRGVSGAQNAANTKKLISAIRSSLPKAKIYYVSMMINNYRRRAWNEVRRSNSIMKSWCAATSRVTYIDITGAFLKNGVPDNSYFVSDRLHLNARGYDIMARKVAAQVVKDMKNM